VKERNKETKMRTIVAFYPIEFRLELNSNLTNLKWLSSDLTHL